MKYLSDLTDTQWEIVEPLFTNENRGAHFLKHSKRELIDAVFYIEKLDASGGSYQMISQNRVQ